MNARQRTIGVDKQYLDQQVAAKHAAKVFEDKAALEEGEAHSISFWNKSKEQTALVLVGA